MNRPGLIFGFALGLIGTAGAQQTPTYHGQIAPIFYRSCTSCHHTGGSGPFSLTTYAEVKRFLSVIDDATSTRFMPPWLPTPGHGAFADTRRLPDADLALLHQWIKAGAAEGSGAVPTPPIYNATWQLGKPDLVLQMDTAISIPANGTDLFTNVILPNPLQGTHWVRAMEIHPGTPRVVHHANVLIDRTASLRRTHPDWRHGNSGHGYQRRLRRQLRPGQPLFVLETGFDSAGRTRGDAVAAGSGQRPGAQPAPEAHGQSRVHARADRSLLHR